MITKLKGELFINGKKYKKKVPPPKASEILRMCREERHSIHKAKVIKGLSISKDGSEFIRYAAEVGNYEDLHKVYRKLKMNHPDATHVVCACRLPGKNVGICKDFTDDEEYGVGQTLLTAAGSDQ